MQSITETIVPAKDVSLITDYAAKLGLNLISTTPTLDEQIRLLVQWSSDEIAVSCNRVLARETVRETYRDFNADAVRIWLSHYPVSDIESIDEDGTILVEGTDYEVDLDAGKVRRLGGVTWKEPTVITYTGGYNLPFEAPLALQQAAIVMAREAYYKMIRGDASVRMIGHKESRVIYFDPNAAAAKASAGGAGGSPAQRAVKDLLTAYTRYEC